MLVIIISWPELKMCLIRFKTRSLGQFLEKRFVLSRRHRFFFIISRPELKSVMSGQKKRSLGNFLEKQCIHARRQSFDPIFMKLCHNVYLTKVKARIKKWVMSDQKLDH